MRPCFLKSALCAGEIRLSDPFKEAAGNRKVLTADESAEGRLDSWLTAEIGEALRTGQDVAEDQSQVEEQLRALGYLE